MKKILLLVIFVMALLVVGFVSIAEAKKGENSGGATAGSNSGSSGSSGDSGSSGSSGDSGSGSSGDDDSTSSGVSDGSSNSKGKSSDSDSDGISFESDKKVELKSDSDGKISSKTKEEQTITLVGEDGNEYKVEVRVETKNRGEESEIKIKVRNVEVGSDVEFEKEGNSLKAKLSNGMNSDVKIMPDTASATAIERLQTKGLEIQLKETGEGNNQSVVYEAEGNKTVKFLGLFKVRSEVKAVISAENGEVLKLEKPWWYFLAFKQGVVDCDADNLDLCDDSFECSESGLVWFNDSCVSGCPEDAFVCDDNETVLSRDLALNCEFDFDACPVIIEVVDNQTVFNETLVNETIDNQTVMNVTLVNETIDNQTVTNETVVNESI